MSANKLPTICIYHGNCADGFGAAWVVRKALGADIEFYAATHGKPAPDVTGKNVVIVDFSFPVGELLAMGESAISVLVLDHHKTAQHDLERIAPAGSNYEEFKTTCLDLCRKCEVPHIGALFDMNRSGAGIAWDFFFPDTPRPALINHIEDRDLWLFKLDGTREILANLFSYPLDFEVWDTLFTASAEEMRSDGIAIERKQKKDVAELTDKSKRRMVIGGFDVPVANLPPVYASDAGHLMCEGESFAACYWDTPDGRSFSLRSSDAGEDVSAIAQQYGGGGHRNASGFRVPFGHILAI
jgi:oligoribonuclease NrnB/cAMP/cGMP phosphodiesterase (DHH superfamily)